MRRIFITALLALAACTTEPTLAPDTPPVTLSGEITRADHQTYRELPFTVPPGTRHIAIDFSYNKDNRTVIDLGLRDPQGQRGWSGGNKTHIEISDTNATPSYKPGKIQPGEWKLVLGIPNIRDGQISSYEATITFSGGADKLTSKPAYAAPTLASPLRVNANWRRGDFHAHTAHSDGSCDVAGARVPCPAINTFEAARDANLDFVAITDHNTITQLADIAAQQKNFPKTLLIPGTEITTFNGHANVIGNTSFLDFQLGSPRLPTPAPLFDQVKQQDAFISVNHPGLPSGEICMGCGWTVKDTDWSRVTAIEVINGSTLRTGGAEGPTSGIRFWDNLLKQGRRITAIGGSDNHDATDTAGAKQSPIGKPATVVYATELSTKAVIAGVKSGRVFIDVAGMPGAILDVEAAAGTQRAVMGGELQLAEGETGAIVVSTSDVPVRARFAFVSENLTVQDANPVPTPAGYVRSASQVRFTLKPGSAFGYIRPEVRDETDKLLLLGNPIYVRPR